MTGRNFQPALRQAKPARRLAARAPALVLAPWLAGCVSVVPQHLLLKSGFDAEAGNPAQACSVAQVPDAFAGARQTQGGLDPKRISLLNWNIYKGQRDNWAADLHEFSRQHDVLTIQEAHLGEPLESLLEASDFHWTMNPAFYYRGAPSGVMTAARVKPVHTCGLRNHEPLIRAPKSILVPFYPLAGNAGTLLVANVHGINFTLGTEAYRQQIQGLSEVVRQHRGPVILAGDFNTWSRARLEIVEAVTTDLGLNPLKYPQQNRTRLFGNPIDHVFYRGLIPEAQSSWHVTSSDHNPIRVSFQAVEAR